MTKVSEISDLGDDTKTLALVIGEYVAPIMAVVSTKCRYAQVPSHMVRLDDKQLVVHAPEGLSYAESAGPTKWRKPPKRGDRIAVWVLVTQVPLPNTDKTLPCAFTTVPQVLAG